MMAALSPSRGLRGLGGVHYTAWAARYALVREASMITLFRRFAKSWVAVILIGLLIVSFAVFGISDVFTGMNANTVVKAGSREVNTAEFVREFNGRKEMIEQRNGGQPIPLDTAVERGLDRQVLDMIASRESIAELVHRVGVRVSDEQVLAEIRKIPAFFDQISGKFDGDLYASKLAEKQYTKDTFERTIRDDIGQRHLLSALATGLKPPRVYAAVGAAYALEGRDLSFFLVDPRSVEQPKAPTDADLTAFMKENSAQLTRPEYRQLTIVRFSAKALEPTVAIDEAELQKRFDFRKDSLSRPEVRTIAQIPAKDAAAAARVQQQLSAGADPVAAAKTIGTEPVLYADKPKTAIVDRKVAEAAFALKEGAVSGPINGELGLSVVKVLKVTPGVSVTLADIRPALEAELRTDASVEKVYALTQTYEDAHGTGDSVTEAARKAGVPVATLPPVTAEGQGPKGEPSNLPPQLLKIAFDLPQGGESDIEELAKGEYYAVRVEKVIAPAMPPLAEIKPQLTRVYMLRKLAEKMQAKADALAERVRKGETMAAVAASTGARVNTVPGISRANAEKYGALGRDMLVKAFGAAKGDVFTAQNPQFGYAVVKLDTIAPAKADAVAATVAPQQAQLSEALFGDIEGAIAGYARTTAKAKTDLDKARLALGLDPKQIPGAAKTEETAQ